MINRLPKDYAAERPANGVRPAPPTEAPAIEPAEVEKWLSNRLLAAAANLIGAHPMISLGVAFGAGALLGKLVKR